MLPYAFLKGKKADTVVMSGHFDVVSTEEYGAAEEYAYQIGNSTLEEMLRDMPLTEQQRADLDSGEWIWGRGVADMKGGLSIHAALFEEYATQAEAGELEGSLLFIPVCDEESYSAGMRSALTLMRMFKEKYDLDYKLLIDPETDFLTRYLLTLLAKKGEKAFLRYMKHVLLKNIDGDYHVVNHKLVLD